MTINTATNGVWTVPRRTACLLAVAGCLASSLTSVPAAEPAILVGNGAPPMEIYAARELQRYLHHISGMSLNIEQATFEVSQSAFVVGQRHNNVLIKRLAAEGLLSVSPNDPGPEGYVLKKLELNRHPIIVIAGSDAAGCLYGVYGLLSDHYGVGFLSGGDVLPEIAQSLSWPNVDERKTPGLKLRGLLPWTNFPQSPAVYSLEDWKFLLDRMAKMRLNLLFIHNYSGEYGHNEMFANFALDGFTSRVHMTTARSGHGWHDPGWDVRRYRFQSRDLFDDYDFGSECALHNESLSNEEVSRKGVSLFQRVIDYAHRRAIKIALGLDIDMVPAEYRVTADNPRVIAARAQQIARDYPALDYLVCFQSENVPKDAEFIRRWRRIFMGFYDSLKTNAPGIRLAVSGWGLNSESVRDLPADVICAPISAYSAGFEPGAVYSKRDYWGIPWLERDQTSSQYYYPYNVHLSKTILAHQARPTNMTGLVALTWRLTDAIEPKIHYIAKVPWCERDQFTSSRIVYKDYAALSYGPDAAHRLTAILNENEPFCSDFGECQGTPLFSVPPKSPLNGLFRGDSVAREYRKCLDQLSILNAEMPLASRSRRPRLELVCRRLSAVRDHLLLNQQFSTYQWRDLPGAMESWVRNFNHRVCDISSLGNVVSVQNRFVQLHYLPLENRLRAAQRIKAPSSVEVRGTATGAVISWSNEDPNAAGFYIYADAKRLHASPLPTSATSYVAQLQGTMSFTVTAVTTTGGESPHSVPVACAAGTGDTQPPHIIVISPPSSCVPGQHVAVKARLLDTREHNSLSAVLYSRSAGDPLWHRLPMMRRARAVFAAELPVTSALAPVQYYIEASDGSNKSRFPPDPGSTLSIIVEPLPRPDLPDAPLVENDDGSLVWKPVSNAFWYRIYRSKDKDFTAGPANYVTFVDGNTTTFADRAEDFEGAPLIGTWYYRVTAETRTGIASEPGKPVAIKHPPSEELSKAGGL